MFVVALGRREKLVVALGRREKLVVAPHPEAQLLTYLVLSKFRDSNQIGTAIQATTKSKASTAN